MVQHLTDFHSNFSTEFKYDLSSLESPKMQLSGLLSLASVAAIVAAYNFTIYQAANCDPGAGFIYATGKNEDYCQLALEYSLHSVRINKLNTAKCNISFVNEEPPSCGDVVATTPSKNFPADGSCHTFKNNPLTWRVNCK